MTEEKGFMKIKDIKLEVGKRYLFLHSKHGNDVYDATVVEISPSGEFVKLIGAGNPFWSRLTQLFPVERLAADYKGIQYPKKEDVPTWLGLDKKQDAQEQINDLRRDWD